MAGPLVQQSLAADPTPPPGAANGWSDTQTPNPAPRSGAGGEEAKPRQIPEKERSATLGKDYRRSGDRAWTTSGDGTGFHLLIADEKTGYQWKTAASLAEEGFETDTWIGNACVTGDGGHAVVTYAPRTFTNKPNLMARGAFAATVDLGTGKVSKLPHTVSLAYFSPGCGTGNQAVLSQFSDEATSDKNETRLITVDATTGKTGAPLKLDGQVTSAVPVNGGFVAADGARLVKLDKSGKRTALTRTNNVPFQVTADADGGVTFLDRGAATAKSGASRGYVKRLDAGQLAGRGAAPAKKAPATIQRSASVRQSAPALARQSTATTLAEGELIDFDLSATAGGKVFVTGKAKPKATLPKAVAMPGGIDKDAQVSTLGHAAVKASWADGKDTRIRPEEALTARTARIDMKHLATGKKPVFEASPADTPLSDKAAPATPSPALPGSSPQAASNSAKPASSSQKAASAAPALRMSIAEPESERTCAVERGNPQKQAFQPKPRQIEWAVDQAITNNLDKHIRRPANWKNMGMGAYSPQALAGGLTKLKGGGRIPAQVMLGITAQESNMWQATRFAAPGVTANSLIGNYYGIKHNEHGEVSDPWAIKWAAADCGYGITQVTDGMRLPGKPYEDGKVRPSLPRGTQEAIALDYSANIAFGVNILAEKWNQTYGAGMTVNDGAPNNIENWFFALWAYNSGFYPKSQAGANDGKWGVGWANNPANPTYKPNRTPFLENSNGGDEYSHAAKPQFWPYPEKVIGWAARPLEALEAPGKLVHGFRPAWWTSNKYRTKAKPPVDLFCNLRNDCDPKKIKEGASNDSPSQGPCQRGDWKCWWNEPVEWKDCKKAECGFELLRFNDSYKEEADGNSHPPSCAQNLPLGTGIVGNVNSGQRIAGADFRRCSDTAQTSGSFKFDFGSPSAKMDTHQLGAGRGNHFWFSNTRKASSADAKRMKVTGTWTYGQDIDGWARVLVHMPNIGARSQQATYTVHGTDSKSPVRVAPQRTRENRWVSLGTFKFTGTPKVSLSNITEEGNSVNVAWDDVAFQKLPGKPTQVVGMGDSFASGEGASGNNGDDYFKETDYSEDIGDTQIRNACHRSKLAWARVAKLPGKSKSIGELSDSYSKDVDLSFVACSGARTYNVLPGGRNQWGNSLPQIDLGYLDQNTSLVTIAIGGNDARFSNIIQACVIPGITCPNGYLDEKPMHKEVPRIITEEVKPAVQKTLAEIKKRAPKAKVVLMGYPPLLDGTCVPNLDRAEVSWMNHTVAPLLTEQMKAAADATGSVFVDPAAEFKGKAICGDPESIHGVVMTGRSDADNDAPQPSMKSFHPKVSGARLYADALERGLK
ncbi:GDSL-type esterase/lipase family protein [Streptomyces sp. E11-3]|uniref:GDSL-type esterase/lipase family protein n=1 Tax=Streptomyces sp. E11-3 TaxID=3110112 RepID=UPI00397F9204